jgi:outer membrane protein TolC
MNTICLQLTAAALLAAPPATALQSLEVFLKAARERNPDAQQASANLAQQNAQALVALGRQLPGVAVQGNYLRNQRDVTIQIPGRTVEIQPLIERSLTATATVPLVDLANFLRIAAANTNAESFVHTLEATRLTVEGQTVQDYYQLLANIALVAAARTYLDVSRENLRLTEAKLRAGTATRLDVDRAVADVEVQVQQLAAAQLQVSLSARDLESRTSITPDISSAQELTDDLHSEAELSVFEGNLPNVPSVKAAVSATRAAQQQAAADKFTLVPSIAGTFTETGTNAPGFQPTNWWWQATITGTWSFDLTTVGNIRSSDAAADATRAHELRVRLDARDAIHRFWQTVAANIAQSRSARAQRDAAVHASDQARVQYRAGTATQLDLLTAQRDAFNAEVTRIQDDANLLNARAQLRLAAGSSLIR